MKVLRVVSILIVLIMLTGCLTGHDYMRFGRSAVERKDYVSAIDYFKTAVNMEPSNAYNHAWLGRAYFEMGQYNDAIVHLKKATELNPKGEDFYALLGMAYSRAGKNQEAVTALKKAIHLKPTDPDNFTWLAHTYNYLKQYDDAIAAAKRAIELKSDYAEAYNALGIAYGKKKQYAEAFNAFKKVIELNPKLAKAHFNYGHLLMEKNSFKEALSYMKKAVELDPNDAENNIGLLAVYTHDGKYDDALAAVNKVITLQTITGIGINSSIEGGYTVVKGVMEKGLAKKADIQVGDKIIKVDGKSTKGWTGEKVTQSLRGAAGTQVVLTIERKEAKRPLEQTVVREKIYSKGASTSFGFRSLIHRYKGNKEESFKDAEKAHSLDSTDDWVRIPLGAAYLDNGKFDEAIKLLSLVNESPPARILEATAYARLKDFKKASAIYNAITEDDEYFSTSVPRREDQKALFVEFKPLIAEHRKKAKENEAKGDYKNALAELSEAIKVADDSDAKDLRGEILRLVRRMPSTPEISEEARKHALRGEVMIRNGEFENAAKEFKTAIKMAPYAAKLYFNTAILYADMKKYPEAIRHMKTYTEMAPEAPDVRTAKDEMIKWEYLMEKKK
ncbi:MAG: tetratricopeptide repeat protein [Syntrophaceae bacterium]|nr:tetratricopeptide repeat protein [Syntrophaceae bacterium]